MLYRLVLLPQLDVAAFDGTLVFPLHVVEGGPVFRVGRTRAKPGNLNGTLRPFRTVPDRAPQHPVFQPLEFRRHPFEIRADELWGRLNAYLGVVQCYRPGNNGRLDRYRSGKNATINRDAHVTLLRSTAFDTCLRRCH